MPALDQSPFLRLSGIALVAAPILLLAGGLSVPASDVEAGTWLTALRDSPEAAQRSSLLSFAGFALLVPAVLGLVGLLGRPGPVAKVGTVLALLGATAFPALVATNFYDIALAQREGASAAGVLEAAQSSTGMSAITVVAVGGLALGLLVLTAALWRAGRAPVWVPAAVLATLICSNATTDPILAGLGWLPLAAALGLLGMRLLRSTASRSAQTAGPRIVAEP